MLSFKEIKKVMKEFSTTYDEALAFLIKVERAKIELEKDLIEIERAKIELQKAKATTITKPTFPVIDTTFETKEDQPKKDEDDIFISQHCNVDTYDKALAEGEARACPCINTDEIKQKLEKLPRTNPRVKKYLEAAEGWIESYDEVDHEYCIPSSSITSVDKPTDEKAAEEFRKEAVWAFIAPLVNKAEEIVEQPNGVNPVFNVSDVQSFYDSLGEED